MAGLMEQSISCNKARLPFWCAKARCTGSVTFWAWIVSIAMHLIVLTAFGIIKFSHSKAQDEQHPVPIAKVNRIKNLVQAAPVIPKPKIKKPAGNQLAKSMNISLPENQIFGNTKPRPKQSIDLAKDSASRIVSLSNSIGLPHRAEFFGSCTGERKICYLVDCSGSMQGMFGRVRRKLAKSIKSLQPDQYFYIIFFGGDRLFEFGKGRLLRATQQTKSAAYDFIESIQPAGRTNALVALERAVQIRDGRGAGPSVIYFLTDGFELTTDDEQKFSQKTDKLLKQFAPETKINTIGFWPQGGDRKMLETIAKQTGGEFVIIAD